MQQRKIGTRARWAAQAGMGLGLAAALASGCGGDAEPPLDSAPLGELSPAQMESLCDEILDVYANRESTTCIPVEVDSSAVIRPNPAPCEFLQSIACEVTAGEVRTCERAQLADFCNGGDAATTACAPYFQRGCASRGRVAPWTDACPDLAAAVAPFEGIYELSRHTVNDTSCDAEGASVLETDAQRLLVVVTILLYGAPIGRMETCDDLEHCREVAESLRRYSRRTDPARAEALTRELLCHPTIEGALESERESVDSISNEGRCDFEQTEEVITRAPDGTLRLEARSSAWQQPIDDGSCFFSGLGEPPPPPVVGCSRFQVYEARLVSTL
jgi:hypothetical protein